MKVLLDTNVLSEVARPRPDAGVIRFLHEADEDRLAVSAITIAEISRGVALLPDGRRRRELDAWLADDLLVRFGQRLLSVDAAVALTWGEMMGRMRAAGRALPVMDGFIAATAVVHELTLVTRNERDFAGLGLSVINPWSAPSPSDPAAVRG